MTLLVVFDDDDIIPDGHRIDIVDTYKKKFQEVSTRVFDTVKKKLKKKKIKPPTNYEQKKKEFQFYESQFFHVVTALGYIDEMEAAKDAAIEAALRDLEDRRETLWVEMLRLRHELEMEMWLIICASL